MAIIFQNYCIFCPKIFFTFTNSVDPDEMQHYAAFHLGLHCFQKVLVNGFPENKWLISIIFYAVHFD